MVASTSEGWSVAEYIQGHLLFGGRKRISIIAFFQTEVILQILIGLDFKGLFHTRAAFLLLFSLLSKEKRSITLSPEIPAHSLLQILQQRPPPLSS